LAIGINVEQIDTTFLIDSGEAHNLIFACAHKAPPLARRLNQARRSAASGAQATIASKSLHL